MSEKCKSMYQCSCECPRDLICCPWDTNKGVGVEKDRSLSRKRHCNNEKSHSRKKSNENLRQCSYTKARFAKNRRKRLKKREKRRAEARN